MRYKLLFLTVLAALTVVSGAAFAQLDGPGYRYPPPPPGYYPPPPPPGYYEERRYEDRRYREREYREAPPQQGYRQPPQRAGGVFCAREGGYCQFQGPAVVRYGAGGRFVRRQAFNGIECSNRVFGDPAVGADKACFIE